MSQFNFLQKLSQMLTNLSAAVHGVNFLVAPACHVQRHTFQKSFDARDEGCRHRKLFQAHAEQEQHGQWIGRHFTTETDALASRQRCVGDFMEDLQDSRVLRQNLERLGKLTRHADAHIRGDACHYLALSGDAGAAAWIRPLLEDADAGVREIASDSLEMIAD